jgi:toxin ParE1/3/4
MRRVEIAARARVDILEALLWLKRHNPAAADRWREAIRLKIELVAEMPGIGAPRDDHVPGLRAVVVRPYAIYFRADDTVVEIVRVLHGSRDHRAIFRGI